MSRRLRAAAALAAWATLPGLPAWAAATALHPRWRRDWAERWGWSRPPVQPGAIWVHAASLGEQRAAEALLAHLPRPVLLTADTDTGAARARSSAAAAGPGVVAGIRPVDHPWVLAPLWAEARPRAVVLVESAWWPQLVARAGAAGVPVLRASARAGEGTRRWGPLWRLLGDGVARTAARGPEDTAFYARLGPAEATGDLKADVPVPPSLLCWVRPFVVAASTRPGDEEAVLDAWSTFAPRPALLLAPRHPERFSEVAALLEARGVPWARRTALTRGEVPAEIDVVLLDTLGELAGCLRGAAAAFAGGTLDPAIGGHSPLEALAAGVPVVAGPHVQAHARAFAHPAAWVVAPSALAVALRGAMGCPRPPPAGDGASARTAAFLASELAHPPAPEATPRPWARPLIPLWAAGAGLRRLWHDARGAVRLPVPVLSVGSPNARGPGRTSTVRWLAASLAARGHAVGVVVRGYRRARPGRDVRPSWEGATAADLGDEGALCAGDGHLVAAGPDRVAAARVLVTAGATAIVLDDALGDRRLHRDVDLLVVDARFPRAGGLLPAGDRREAASRPARATGIVVHHAADPAAAPIPPGAAVATRILLPWHRGDTPADPPPGPVAALLGVARPGDALASFGVPVARVRVLRDHQPVDGALAAEIRAWAGDTPLVCTAKDAVRLPRFLRATTWWRDLRVEVRGAPESWFPEVRP